MTCPKDAKGGHGRECRAIMRGLTCTRKKDHRGKHHAHGMPPSRCIRTWTTTEAVIEAL